MIIDIDRIRSRLSYDKDSGVIRWIHNGKKAGCRDVYLKVRIDGRLIYGHRVAWVIHYGEQPPSFIDHINGDPLDNRICNLRAATKAQNSRNSKTPKKRTCSLKGVTLDKFTGTYKASISINGRLKHIGRYKTELEAHEAYVSAAISRDSEFYRAQ